jgi:hypothetical protein
LHALSIGNVDAELFANVYEMRPDRLLIASNARRDYY